ncbi:MAG TPA: GNAT family N-acetyltransferase [Actinomycetota bacterium]|nr:GNAT family N-acetyltransferase [Actinomycetota bacterium]
MSRTIAPEEASAAQDAAVAPCPDETALDVVVHRTPEAFDLPEWPDLLARDPDRHVFATPEWNRTWWEEFSSGKELLVLELRRGGETTAIVPLYRKEEDGRGILRFVGGIDLTDYIGPVCAPDDRRAVAAALVTWLRSGEVEWDELDGHNMPVPLGFAEYLVERADTCDFRFALDQEETAAVLRLPEEWDAYLAGLDSKERHELKRKRRRLYRDHPDAVFRTATPETLEGDMKTFVDMHRGAEGLKGHFMRPEVATFFERMATTFMPLGWLRLDFLEVGGRAVASTFGFELDRVFYLYNSAYEPDAGRLSPGLMLVSSLVEGCIERGFERFDFLRGPERYKYQLGSEAVPLNNVRVIRSASAGPPANG